jgi:hypothetical protein
MATPITTARVIAAVLAASFPLLTACSEDEPAADDSAADQAAQEQTELVEWAEAFCAAPEVIPDDLSYLFMAAARHTPTVEEDRQPLIDALAEVDLALADALAAMETLPPAPTPEAEAAAEQYRADLEETSGKFADYAELAPVYPTEELEGLYMLAGIDSLNLPYPLMMAETYLTESALSEAAAEAPACGGGNDAEEPTASGTDE